MSSIDEQSYLRRIEKTLSEHPYPFSEDLCKEFSWLSTSDQLAYARALNFAGCKEITPPDVLDNPVVDEKKRIQAARIILMALYVDTGEPRWSSYLIDHRVWNAILDTPGGECSDLFKALFALLGEGNYGLTRTMIIFIDALTYRGRMELMQTFHSRYMTEDFSWILATAESELTAAQAYLLALVLPQKYLSSPELAKQILESALSRTIEYEAWKLLLDRFYDTLKFPSVIEFFKSWLAKGIESPFRDDILEVISSSSG